MTKREILPVPDLPRSGLVTYDAKDPDTTFPPIAELRPPAEAPNVLVVLIDDAGFGSSSAFGGPCATPNAERLAAGGLKLNRFHTTALCSPTRAALLSGRNHHTVGMGGITEIATSAPGYNSMRPNTCAPLAEILKLNGYSTAQFGKCHEVPVWQTSPMGPFDNWPTGSGFEYFYGFIGGEAHQYYPALYEGTIPVEPDRSPEEGYHLMGDMTDKAITWVQQQKSLMPDKPFFMYFAPGATHAPHHVPNEWSDKYKGRFDDGWDALRERTIARQKELGVIPQDARLTRRHDEIPAWDDMPEALKPVLRRQMEIYAGFMEFTDHHVGRLVDALEGLEILDDTLVFYIVGDNGASAEGTLNGTFNEMINFNGAAALETPEFMLERLDEFGGPDSYNHYAVGWAHAMDTPYQWTKQVASHFGGTRNGTIVHWPKGISAQGEIRTQFTHVTDIAPTVLDVAGLSEPTMVHGVQQTPMQGVSMRYAFDDAGAGERHETQYFEMFGNRGIYHKGWTAVTRHKTPWLLVGEEVPAFDDDVWELYDTSVDWTQFEDVSAQHPDRLHELQRLFLIEATRNNVLPLDDRAAERIDPAVAGRPTLIKGSRQRLFGGMGRLSESSVVSIKNSVARGDGGDRRPRRHGRAGRDRRPGRQHRRLEPVRRRRPAALLLQPVRRPALPRRHGAGDPHRDAPGADGVRLRRPGPGEGRHGDAVRRRRGRGAGHGRRDGGDDLLGRRHLRRRQGGRRPGGGRLPRPQRVHRRRAVGRDRRRRRRGRRGPPARSRRAPPRRDGAPVTG